ncbi:MAG: hypothetical protein ACO3MV_02070 [Flavobacteriales bacterium]
MKNDSQKSTVGGLPPGFEDLDEKQLLQIIAREAKRISNNVAFFFWIWMISIAALCWYYVNYVML